MSDPMKMGSSITRVTLTTEGTETTDGAKREKELAISLAQGGADPNVVTAVVEGELRKHFNFKRQAKQSTGDGNPHMQISGRNADLQFRETLNHFWWTKTNFKEDFINTSDTRDKRKRQKDFA